jgi:nitrite reductase (NADH) small subunit/3-phenylpropionate/trans-cinnamate dioxygenase ferredoxin subunit
LSSFYKAARVREVPPGTGRTVEVNGVKVALFNVEGRFHAIDDRCPHSGGALGEGILQGCVVTCPYHFWQFDVRHGRSPEFPDARVASFEVKLVGDEVHVCDSPVEGSGPAEPVK